MEYSPRLRCAAVGAFAGHGMTAQKSVGKSANACKIGKRFGPGLWVEALLYLAVCGGATTLP